MDWSGQKKQDWRTRGSGLEDSRTIQGQIGSRQTLRGRDTERRQEIEIENKDEEQD